MWLCEKKWLESIEGWLQKGSKCYWRKKLLGPSWLVNIVLTTVQ